MNLVEGSGECYCPLPTVKRILAEKLARIEANLANLQQEKEQVLKLIDLEEKINPTTVVQDTLLPVAVRGGRLIQRRQTGYAVLPMIVSVA